MKTPQKDKKSLKGKSRLSLSKAQSSQTITSLFKQISKSLDVQEGRKTNVELEANDDDVQIVRVEVKADKYFKHDSAENCAETIQTKGLSKVGKLKLRRSKFSINDKDSVDGKPLSIPVIPPSVDCKFKPEMETFVNKIPTLSQGSSQKENEKKNDTCSTSTSVSGLSGKLSLRKRRSDNADLLAAPRRSKRGKSEEESNADSSDCKHDTESSSGSKNTSKKQSNKPISGADMNKNSTSKRGKVCDKSDSVMFHKGDHRGDKCKKLDREHSEISANPGGERKNARESSTSKGENLPDSLERDEESSDSQFLDSCDDTVIASIGDIDIVEKTSERKTKKDGIEKGGKPGGSRDLESVTLIDEDSLDSRISVSDLPDPERVDGVDIKAEQDKTKYRDRTPYYLENFSIIVNSVMDDQDYLQLFNLPDMEVINTFKGLTEPAQKLYVRLFSRKLTWHLSHKICYPEIADDLTPILGELITAHLVISATDLNDLGTVLSILPAASLKTLAKSFNMSLNQTKPQLVEALTKQSKQNTIGSFFTKKCRGGAGVMLERAKKLLGESFKVVEEPRAVFVRILNLFSLLNYNPDEESSTATHGGLFQMLLVNMGKLVYPKYTISKKTSIFRSRDDLLRFSSALLVENEMLTCTEKGDFKGAHQLYLDAKTEFEEMIKDNEQLQWDHSLPVFLRRYTARQVYTRILSEGVEVLQRLKLYSEAVKQLRELLDQSDYCPKYRGHWYDRLALNLDQHLGQQQESLEVIKAGLMDHGVRVGHRYNLHLRAQRLCSKPKSKFADQLADIEPVEVQEYPKVTIEGKVLAKTIPGARFTFVQEVSDSEEGITVCGVEELVLDHYRYRGFPEGIHAEGGIVSTLFGLYFWDVIFMDIPDAFHSPFQAHPLDHHSDHFYQARHTQIDDRLAEIEDMDEQALEQVLAQVWEERHGVLCGGLNWERFTGPEQAQGLVRCLGGKALSGLLARYARDPRNTRSGFPDLTLWNPALKTVKFSEVKGPGDRLSSNQIMWLDYLMRLGIDAEVCHVKAVTSKKLKRH